MRTRPRTHRLKRLAATAAAIALAGCGFLGGGEEQQVISEPPSIRGSTTQAPEGMPAPAETPTVTAVERISTDDDALAVMRTPVANGDYHLGIAASCGERGAMLTISLGPFPGDYRPVQLAVRTVDGETERFGPVLKLGIEHGFHSPTLEEERDIERFLAAALQEGALISNGFYSFFNQAGEAAADTLHEVLQGCTD